MNFRLFGNTGFQCSEIGLGCWQIGGGDWGAVDESQALKILSAATDEGVNFFDTADVYGGGRSEELIGRFLKGHTGRIFVATKLGRAGGLYPDNYSEAGLRAATESSLKKLGVETLDLTQLHCIPGAVLLRGEVFDWLRKLKEEGKIRAFGVSVESVEEAEICLGQDGLTSLQVIFNIFRQKPAASLLPAAQARGVGIIVRLPLASGLLGGRMSKDTKFEESDHRHYNRDGAGFNVGETFAGLGFETGVELADALKPLIPAGMSMAEVAQRWILDHPAVSTVITGASKESQVRDNAPVSRFKPLPAELHETLASFYREEVAAKIRGPY